MSLSNLLDAGTVLQQLGPWALGGIGLIIFIESGVLFPFLPGDSLLVTAAALHVQLGLTLWQVALVASIAAVAGDQVGFWLGHRYGRRLFTHDARVLRTDRLRVAEEFFARRGPLALVLGRFVPIVRTYVPVAAGTAQMSYSTFVGWNVGGALAWVASMTAVGALLGNIPGITHSIDGIMILIIGISVMPMVISALRAYWKKRRA
ncbi:DedA family protein [Arcanobacterium canis]|uniref:DedA family protein n=1 Tax=Arcanobacterium canis TaxID=999183 RepID=A0ABY8G148_9ACTO|nr:DedA family protein [Arcanobacterium canis]WFM83700.1 DedA family protein [Arcanobacterium canis]